MAEAGEITMLTPGNARASLIAAAMPGARIMRALVLRRVRLIERGAGGPLIVAPADHPGRIAIAGFPRRNGFPFMTPDPDTDPVAADLLHGVFAIGDVRAGSVKRVGGAI